MHKFIRGFAWLVASVLAMPSFAQDNVIDEVVWIVGDEAILKSEVEEERLRMLYENQKIQGDPYCVIPEQIAIQKLFLHQAKIDSIEVSDQQVFQEVEARLNFYISQIGSKEKMEEYFRKTTSQLREELRQTVRDQSTVQQMQQELVSNLKITPTEVRRYYEELPAEEVPFIPTQVEVQLLTFEPKIPQDEIDDIKSRLRDYSTRVTSGESEFSTLAILFSQDPGSAANGGELGFKGKGEFVPEFSEVAFQLNDPKKVSKIVESEFGYHIIQLIEKRGDRSNFRHILLTPRVSDTELTSTMARMDSLYNDIDSAKFEFEEAVAFLSHDKDTRMSKGLMVNHANRTSKFAMEELPAEIARQVDGMEVGSMSKPFIMKSQKNGRDIVAMVKLKSRLAGHKATIFDDFQTIKTMYEGKKREQIIEDFIKKKQSETYVRIKDGWNNCEFNYPGWVKK